MINLKTEPVGIDYEIQRIQQYLYDKLSNWNLECFGRAEIIENKPLVYQKKNDYKEVLFIDGNTNGKFFFVDSEKTSFSKPFLKTEVDLYFLLDTKKIKTSITHRSDEEIRMDILNVLKKRTKEIEIIKGQKALSDFKTELKDMQPYHFIKFSFELKYSSVQNCF